MRIFEIDVFRGIGIFLVVVYHIFYDLNFFSILKFSMNDGALMVVGRTSAILLIFTVGISLNLSWIKAVREKKNLIKKYFIRALMLFGVGILISAATFVYPGKGWIFFGIIQFISFAIFAAHFFLKYFKLNLILGILSIALGFYIRNFSVENIFLFILGFSSNIYTLDYFPIFPWIGVVFLGMFFSKAVYEKKMFEFKIAKNDFYEKFAVMGKNSLMIYLLHQPVLIAIVFILMTIFG